MAAPQTLLQMTGADPKPVPWPECAVLFIDCQNEYLNGALPLTGIEAALDEGRELLERARAEGAPIVHVRHQGKPGGAFDWEQSRGQICDAVAPTVDERIVGKTLPNSFAGTELASILSDTGRSHVIVAGFMTHMCVSATVRSALDHGFFSTIVAGACATRDLPDGRGGVVPAATVHETELAALADRFCVVVPDTAALP